MQNRPDGRWPASSRLVRRISNSCARGTDRRSPLTASCFSGNTPGILLAKDADLARHFYLDPVYLRTGVSHSYNTARRALVTWFIDKETKNEVRAHAADAGKSRDRRRPSGEQRDRDQSRYRQLDARQRGCSGVPRSAAAHRCNEWRDRSAGAISRWTCYRAAL